MSAAIDPAKHLGLLHSIAGCFKRRYPKIEFEEFVSWGYLGLSLAAERFNPEKGFEFSTFAGHYIRGFMLNGKASLKPMRLGQVASFKLSKRRIPTTGPIDDALNIAAVATDIDSQIDAKDQAKNLMRCLNEREGKIIRQLYWRGKSRADVGREMGLSRERIRQIEAGAIRKMQRMQNVAA